MRKERERKKERKHGRKKEGRKKKVGNAGRREEREEVSLCC